MVKEWIHKKLFSINGYIMVGVMFVLVVSMPFLYKNIMGAYRSSVFEQFQTHIREEAGLLSDVLSTTNIGNKDDVRAILDSVLLKGFTVYIDIVDGNGDVIFSASQQVVLEREVVEDTVVSGNQDDVYYLFLPIRFDDSDKIYTLRAGFDESALQDEYEYLNNKIYIILFVYTLGVFLLMTTATRLILKPLRELREQSTYITNGKINAPLDITTRLRDIKYLSRDLECMRKSLVDMAERMQHKATHDDLTGLPNRFLFNDRLKTAISISLRENRRFAVLLMDLNRFKEINDTLGHRIGDETLKAVASRMLGRIRGSDTFARLGGDEFSIILMEAGKTVAEKLAAKLIEETDLPVKVGGHTLKVGVSIGISVFPQDGQTAEQLLHCADVAMYSAKRSNLHFSCYHMDMDRDSSENLLLVRNMKKAILEGQFKPLFHPKIDLQTNQPCGCEILMRWEHPELGLINPQKFIPLAEQENLISLLTRWIVEHPLVEVDRLRKAGLDFHVSINVSAKDLLDHSLHDTIDGVLRADKFVADRLFIEVTENAIMKNPARSADILQRFHDSHIKVSVDDFGTGYSSLFNLQKFPISELKIDKSFISELRPESNNYPIVNATIAMAHDLGISVVAEGVESELTLELLREMNCDRAQGYLFCRPLELKEFENWLARRMN